jgi:hypothetical protein
MNLHSGKQPDYFKKYLKYKNKYINLRSTYLKNSNTQQNGGAHISEFKDLFDAFFGDKWVLTGSEAIRVLSEYFNLAPLSKEPSDIDIIYQTNDLFYQSNISTYTRKQQNPEKSMTFIDRNTNKSFDLSTTNSTIDYYIINGIRVHSPTILLSNYEDIFDEEELSKKIIPEKIQRLKEIIKEIKTSRLKLEHISNETNVPKRMRNMDEDETIPLNPFKKIIF